MIKNSKKITKKAKKQLRFLVEDYLEKSDQEILSKISAQQKVARRMWNKLEPILFADKFWMDEIDSGDMIDSDYEKVLMEYHGFLQPIWNQFRDALFNFKYEILPERVKLEETRNMIDTNSSFSFSEFVELLKHDTALDFEKFYDISLKVSFDPGHVTFYRRRMNVAINFLNLMDGVDIEYFAKCEYCAKCIFISRVGKKFCPGCAAKKYQQDKWAEDPEGMKEKERARYRERRKSR